MSFCLTVSDLYFEYEFANEPLFKNLSLQFSPGWTSIVGANGSGKTTLLKLLSGKLKPDSGYVQRLGTVEFCEQNVFLLPLNLIDLFNSYDRYAYQLQDNLRLTPDMPERWDTLSFGERKKLQIAYALWNKPDILCIDEPTNHLDKASRTLLLRELKNYRGIGVIVSHDREVLDTLSARCLFLEHGKAIMRSGGYSSGIQSAKIELKTQLKKQSQLKKKIKKSKRELQRRREKEQKANNKNSKRRLAKHDLDGRAKINSAIVSGRNSVFSDLAGAQAKEIAKINSELLNTENVKRQKFTLKIPYGVFSKKNVLSETSSKIIELGADNMLQIPELTINSMDRIALTGENGAGKSSLLRQIVKDLKLEANDYLYMPQELDEAMCQKIYNTLRSLSHYDFSSVMNVIASLGSRPERVLDSKKCSPGEWRKLFFGLGVLQKINLIIMDEPTNHLDLPSIECLESALRECHSALLLISHDYVFMKNLCKINWHIESVSESKKILTKQFLN